MAKANTGLIAAGVFCMPVLYHLLKPKLPPKSNEIEKLGKFHRPPFPRAIREMLSKCRLAYL